MNPQKEKKNSPNPVLVAACNRNLPINMKIEGERPPVAYRSRFLAFEERPEEMVMVIEAPAPKGSVLPIRPGQTLRIAFTLNNQESYFETNVLDRGRHQLNQDISVASLELQMPEEVFSGEKRGFYRIAIDQAKAIKVKLGILAEDEGGSDRVRWRERAFLTDIGGGGLGFRIPEGKSLLLSPDTRLVLRFKLRSDEQEIKLKGRICFSLRQPELREAFFGVQFVDIDTAIEYKQNVDRVFHHVAEEQRRIMGERAG